MEKVSESNKATAMVVRPPSAAELEDATNILLVTKPMITAGGLFGISPIHAFAITTLNFTENTVIGIRGSKAIVEFPKDLQYISVSKELIEFFEDSSREYADIPDIAVPGSGAIAPTERTVPAIIPGQYL